MNNEKFSIEVTLWLDEMFDLTSGSVNPDLVSQLVQRRYSDKNEPFEVAVAIYNEICNAARGVPTTGSLINRTLKKILGKEVK
jgi:hypothetical protein